jgi:Flp pilus assembly pilin Flp
MGYAGKRAIPESRFPGMPSGEKMNELKRFVSKNRDLPGFAFLRALIRECDGQDVVEYCLLIAVVVLGAAAALSGFQNIIGNVWSKISSNLNSTN